jgi:MFS family permease
MATSGKIAPRNADGPIGSAPASAASSIIHRYYSVWTIYAFGGGFLYGVYPLFLRSRGLSQFEMNSVLATYFAVTFLTDVPTGAFADAFGRRRAFVVGCLLRASAFMLYFFAHRYAVFLAAEAIDGVGTTFCNGAIDAWGVDALDAAGFTGLKDRLFSRISQFTNLGFMLSAIVGAWVGSYNLAWPWLLGAAGYLVSAAAGRLMMGEPRRARTLHRPHEAVVTTVARRIGRGFRAGFASRAIFILSLANGAFFAAWAPSWLEWPQFFADSYRIGPWIVGWIYALFTVARMAGAEAVVRIGFASMARARMLTATALTVAVAFAAAWLVSGRTNAALGCFVAMNLGIGALLPMAQSWFNEEIGSADRATMLSFNSTFATLGAATGLLSTGAFADVHGIPAVWAVSAAIMLLAALLYWRLVRPSEREPVVSVQTSV